MAKRKAVTVEDPMVKIAKESALDVGLGGEVEFWVDTGSPVINWAVSGSMDGGIPHGRITVIRGPYSSGKSLVLYATLAAIQAQGGVAALYDVEQSARRGFLAKMGVDVDKLLYSDEIFVEDVFDSMMALIAGMRKKKDDRPIVIGMDSLAALMSRHEAKGKMKEKSMDRAVLIAKGIRKVNKLLALSNACLFIVNQERERINTDKMNPFKRKTKKMPGGQSVGFFAATVISMGSFAKIWSEGSAKRVLGVRCRFTISKNKVSTPFRAGTFDLYFVGKNVGVDHQSGVTDMLKINGLLDVRGGRYFIKGRKKSLAADEILRYFDQHRAKLNDMLMAVEERI